MLRDQGYGLVAIVASRPCAVGRGSEHCQAKCRDYCFRRPKFKRAMEPTAV
jgi:hypothetical protein